MCVTVVTQSAVSGINLA